jgi:uncharacterized SAM-binding protein YcdF (DUF218 family)
MTGPGSFSMPPPRSRPGGRFRRLTIFILGIVIALALWMAVSLGHILYQEDALARADVIFVLGGAHLDRAAEAGHLYLEGWAPLILLSRHLSDGAEVALRARGLTIPSVADIQRQALVQMGVPATAIEVLEVEQETTASESRELRGQFAARRWSRIIVVTSKLHTARAGLVLRRYFADTGVQVIMRASRYDAADIDRWWARRSDFRFAVFELQKLMAYWIGVAD